MRWYLKYPTCTKPRSVSNNTMKTLKVIFFLLTLCSVSYGQDGSDIRYFEVSGVDNSLLGQFIHFDFFNRSFGGRTIDTVTISVGNSPIRFIERRKDDGYNNWFSQQCLQSIDKIDGQTTRVSKFRLDSITTNSFQVTMYLDFYDSNNRLFDDKSRQVKYWFDKKDIIEVLVKSKQL
jgi:hypothetical protein